MLSSPSMLVLCLGAFAQAQMHIWTPDNQISFVNMDSPPTESSILQPSPNDIQALLAHHLGVAQDVVIQSPDLLNDISRQSPPTFGLTEKKKNLIVVMEGGADSLPESSSASYKYKLPSNVEPSSWLSLVALHSLRHGANEEHFASPVGVSSILSSIHGIPHALRYLPTELAQVVQHIANKPSSTSEISIEDIMNSLNNAVKIGAPDFSIVHVPSQHVENSKEYIMKKAAEFAKAGNSRASIVLNISPCNQKSRVSKPLLEPFGTVPAYTKKQKRQFFSEPGDTLDAMEEEIEDILETVIEDETNLKGSNKLDKEQLPVHPSANVSANLRKGQTVLIPSDGRCYKSVREANEATDYCSGNGAPVKGVSPQGKDCYVCACSISKKGTKVTYWSGPKCNKEDLSSPFFLLASTGAGLIIASVVAVAAIFNMGSEPLPQMLSAMTSNGHMKSD